MLGRVKDFLGIEGVRLSLEVDPPTRLANGLLRGRVLLSSLRPRQITTLSLRLEERYERGRGHDKLIDVYTLGTHREAFELRVGADETVELPFALTFTSRSTPVDVWAAQSVLLRPLGALARLTVGARSTFTLYAQAEVRGVALGPEAELELELG